MGFIRTFSKMNRYNAVTLATVAMMGASGVIFAAFMSSQTWPHTLSKEWIAANQEYRKFQNMDPISSKHK